MIAARDIHRLAGLFEGEGFFYKRPPHGAGRHATAALGVQMTDHDVIVRAAALMRAKPRVVFDPRPRTKPTFRFDIHGRRAAEWMMTLYSLMGRRRRAKVRELLAIWRAVPARRRDVRGCFA